MAAKNRIGFIGTGVMGKSMVARLLQTGYPVMVYNRTKSKTDGLVAEGAVWKDTVANVVQDADIVITMVGYPKDVEDVYFGEQGIFNHAQAGAMLIDMTTSKPTLAEKIAAQAQRKNMHAFDAPVSGGDVGARNGTLTIMVGGETQSFLTIKPVLEAMGENIHLQGEAGAGQHTKMANQITIASNMMGVAEAMVYAENAGLNPENVLQSIGSGAAGSWSLSNLAPRMIQGDFAPGFYVKHFIKDMAIALEAAEAMNMPTPGLAQAKKLYDELAANGGEEDGTQALYKLYHKAADQ